MLSNINNKTNRAIYPTREPKEVLSGEEIKELYNILRSNRDKFNSNDMYYQGMNKAITEKRSIDKNAPDNRIITPYARTMTQIVTGYMGKPEMITYHSNDEQYEVDLKQVLDNADEGLKTNNIIADQSKYGIAFEYIYVDDNSEIEIMVLDPKEILPVYDNSATDDIWVCLRAVYVKTEDSINNYYDLYIFYIDRIEKYQVIETLGSPDIQMMAEDVIYINYGMVPIIDYWNNNEAMADYEPVKSLIDSYDLLNSDAINETERFASAYLVMKNVILADSKDPNQQAAFLDRIKQSRIFSVSNDGDIQFLTKNIPVDFINSMRQAIREDIQYHSHIPDFRDQAFRAQSGEAQKWALFDFENLCSEKEARIREGLEHRLEIINNIMAQQGYNVSDDVTIKFERNIPTSDTMMIDNAVKLKQNGILSDEDILKILPADMVGDIQEALLRLNNQKTESMKQFDLQAYSVDQNTTEDNSDEGQ